MAGGLVTFNDNDDVQLKGATDATLIGNVSDSLKTSVTASALPTGAATAALQTTGNNSLASIDAGIPAALGQTTMSASMPVAIASDQTGVPVKLSDATGNNVTLGQKAMASSLPVVISSDQSAIPTSHSDIAPANGSITVVDSGTSNLTGANGQVFYFGTPTTNSAATFTLSSIENVTVQANILGGGGTLVVEVSMDSGSFWLRPNVYQISTQSYTNSFTAPFIAAVNVAGMTNIRVRAITSWAGTATIIVKESINARSVTVSDALPAGANVIGGVTQSGTWNINNVSGTVSLPTGAATESTLSTRLADATFTARINTLGQKTMANSTPVVLSSDQTVVPVSDNGGSLTVDGTVTANQGGAPWSENITQIGGSSLSLGQKTSANSIPVVIPSDQIVSIVPTPTTVTTYSSAIAGVTVAALATDIFTLTGSATTVVRVTKVAVSANGSAGANVNLALIKRSTANTGGTSTTPAVVPHDSNDAAGTAVTRAYTVNPTLGTTIGTIRVAEQFVSGVVTAGSALVEWDFADVPSKPVVLRGTSQVLAVNLAGVTITGGSYNFFIEWTEAAT